MRSTRRVHGGKAMRLAEPHFGFAGPHSAKCRAFPGGERVRNRFSGLGNLRYLPRIEPSVGEPPPDLPCIGANGCQNGVLKDF